ncbi:MAG: rhodanese-like domain-containing protein [Holophagaceae bacterium]|uniref:Rhodanese-like domain-containing protein n=1 Tax=Candidatus Geothrix skivensis TaxID=2954439 RepID=A0A9D7SDX3_9BACT|nr:rhodanese-like domain-containing protein [Candidatus Geothrix skivensis]
MRLALALLLTLALPAQAQDPQLFSLEQYLLDFDYAERRDMKIGSRDLVKLLQEKKAILVDIRFKEEHAAWRMGFGLQIPLNELPRRLKELDRTRLIVTACPHKDRSALAMAYLKTQGFDVKYLEDGLLGLAELLRGDKARDFKP